MGLNGVNIVGGEISYIGGNTTNPVAGSDYAFVSHQDIDYLAAKNISFARLVFSWEVLQPALNQPLANNIYNATLQDRVAYFTSKGISVMLEIHGGGDADFARYKGNVIGSAAVPNSAFADFWSRMAFLYKNNPKVIFGLVNEPTKISTMQWYSAAQACINAIRATGATNMIMVPGNGWTGAGSWTDNWYDTASNKVSNAVGWLTLNDPLNNTVVSVHMYMDPDAGGGTTDIVSATIGVERLSKVVNWARANGKKVHVGEIGASTQNALSAIAVKNVCDYCEANKDVVIGWAWWAYGPPSWWGGYRFTLCPTNNYSTDDAKWKWLAPYLQVAPPTPTTSVPNIKLTSTKVKTPGDQGYNTLRTVGAGKDIPAGDYVLKTATRTTYSDANIACVNIILSNDHADVDLSWDSITLDMRGHTLQDVWNATVSSSNGTLITITPTADTKNVLAQNKTSFGFCFKRSSDPNTAYYQVLIKGVKW